MNILYLTNHANTGGITSYVLTLGSGLVRKGHNIYLASSGGDMLPKFIESGIKFIPVPLNTKSEISPKVFLSVFKLRKAVKENKIDLVHANSRTTQVAARFLSAMTGVPYISTCHGFFKRRFSRVAFPCWGKRAIAISVQVKEHLVGDFGMAESNVALIHSGVDMDRFRAPSVEHRAQVKNKYGLSDGPVIGIIARLSEEKGHSYLIQAMPQVLNAFGQAQLLVIGSGRREKEIRGFVRALGLEKNVVFLPAVSDTAEALAVMDIFVLPSLKEGLGLALMEAMAQGLAVVGSNVGGIKTLIRHEDNGLLVEPSDSSGLSAVIVELLKDASKRESLGRKAKDFILRNFSQTDMVNQTEELYSACLS